MRKLDMSIEKFKSLVIFLVLTLIGVLGYFLAMTPDGGIYDKL